MENFSDTLYTIGSFSFSFILIYLIYTGLDQKRHIKSNADYSLAPWWVKTTLWTVHRRSLALKSLLGCYILIFTKIVQYPFENIDLLEVFLWGLSF